jgi:hypothetical protein
MVEALGMIETRGLVALIEASESRCRCRRGRRQEGRRGSLGTRHPEAALGLGPAFPDYDRLANPVPTTPIP